MRGHLATQLTTTLTQVAELRQTLVQAQCDLLAWQPASATSQGQALYLRDRHPTLVTFCPTGEAARLLAHLWEGTPYTLAMVPQWQGFLCTLTRTPA